MEKDKVAEAEVDRLVSTLDSIRTTKGEGDYREALVFAIQKAFLDGVRLGVKATS